MTTKDIDIERKAKREEHTAPAREYRASPGMPGALPPASKQQRT